MKNKFNSQNQSKIYYEDTNKLRIIFINNNNIYVLIKSTYFY